MTEIIIALAVALPLAGGLISIGATAIWELYKEGSDT